MKRLVLISLLALAAFARGDEATIKEALERFQKDRDVKALVAAVGTAEYPSARTTLEAELGTDDHAEHAAALEALGTLQGRFEETVYPILDVAAHDDARCRLATVSEVVRIAKTPVRDAYEKVLSSVLASYMGSDKEEVSAAASVALALVLGKPVAANDAKAAALLHEETFKEKLDPEALAHAKTEARKILVQAQVELQALIKSANDALKRLADAGSQAAVEDACRELATLEEHLREKGDVGVKNAQAIELRVSALRTRLMADFRVAQAKKKLVVTAIVVDPRPESKSRAIIHYAGAPSIYEEGDPIRGKDDRSVPDLKVAKIAAGVVTFQLDGATDFTVELKKAGE
ncbi:MAG TPA: hypothetical protein VFF73_11770 [Planctomycetota bacterium]|nr:hypothetical protein [Planctomycetota bacterium]